MAIYENKRPVSLLYEDGRPVIYAYESGRLVYDMITGYLFTSDGYSIGTEDGYMIKCIDQ